MRGSLSLPSLKVSMFRIRIRGGTVAPVVLSNLKSSTWHLHQRIKVSCAIKGGARNRRQKRPNIAIFPCHVRPKMALGGSVLAFLPFFNISIKLHSNLGGANKIRVKWLSLTLATLKNRQPSPHLAIARHYTVSGREKVSPLGGTGSDASFPSLGCPAGRGRPA